MDRQNGFFRGEIDGLSSENADTATPRDRIDKALRDRIFAEEDGIFPRQTPPGSTVAASVKAARKDPRNDRSLLRRIGNYSLAMAQASSYLDAHPNDSSVLRYYDTYRTLLDDCIRAYEDADNFP